MKLSHTEAHLVEPPAIKLFAEQSALPKPQPDLAASKPEKGS